MRLACAVLAAGLVALAARLSAQTMTVPYCIVQNGALVDIQVQVDTRSNDTTYQGRPLSALPQDPYAANQVWYINGERLPFQGANYVKYGLPRVLGEHEVVPAGTANSLMVFAEVDKHPPYEVIYVPVVSGCEFQPYQVEAVIYPVRG